MANIAGFLLHTDSFLGGRFGLFQLLEPSRALSSVVWVERLLGDCVLIIVGCSLHVLGLEINAHGRVGEVCMGCSWGKL